MGIDFDLDRMHRRGVARMLVGRCTNCYRLEEAYLLREASGWVREAASAATPLKCQLCDSEITVLVPLCRTHLLSKFSPPTRSEGPTASAATPDVAALTDDERRSVERARRGVPPPPAAIPDWEWESLEKGDLDARKKFSQRDMDAATKPLHAELERLWARSERPTADPPQFTRYTIEGKGQTAFKLIEDRKGAWMQSAEVDKWLAALPPASAASGSPEKSS